MTSNTYILPWRATGFQTGERRNHGKVITECCDFYIVLIVIIERRGDQNVQFRSQ